MSQTWCHLAGGKTYEGGASAPAGKARCSSPRREKCRGISHWCFPLANLARAICHRSLGLVASYTTETEMAQERLPASREIPPSTAV